MNFEQFVFAKYWPVFNRSDVNNNISWSHILQWSHWSDSTMSGQFNYAFEDSGEGTSNYENDPKAKGQACVTETHFI